VNEPKNLWHYVTRHFRPNRFQDEPDEPVDEVSLAQELREERVLDIFYESVFHAALSLSLNSPVEGKLNGDNLDVYAWNGRPVGSVTTGHNQVMYHGIIRPGSEVALVIHQGKRVDQHAFPFDFGQNYQSLSSIVEDCPTAYGSVFAASELNDALDALSYGVALDIPSTKDLDGMLLDYVKPDGQTKFEQHSHYAPSGYELFGHADYPVRPKNFLLYDRHGIALYHRGHHVASVGFNVFGDTMIVNQLQSVKKFPKSERKKKGISRAFLNLTWPNAMLTFAEEFARKYHLREIQLLPASRIPISEEMRERAYPRLVALHDLTGYGNGFMYKEPEDVLYKTLS